MKTPAMLVALVHAEESDTLLQGTRLQKHHEESPYFMEGWNNWFSSPVASPDVVYNFGRGAYGDPGCGDAPLIEDCSNKDFFTWKGNNKDTFEHPTYHSPTWAPGEYGEDAYWKTSPVNMTPFFETGCVAYVNTKTHGGASKTCKGWCEDNGMVCNAAMDNAHWQTDQLTEWLGEGTRCTLQPVSSTLTHKLPPSSKAIDQSDNGCNAEWNTQICGCAKFLDGSRRRGPDGGNKCVWPNAQLPTGGVQDCTGGIFHVWKGDKFGFEEPTYAAGTSGSDGYWYSTNVDEQDIRYDGACVAYVANENRQSCDQWCSSFGWECVRAMDDAHWQKEQLSAWDQSATNACTLWPQGESRQVNPNENGCAATYKTQICACKAPE